MQTISIQNVNTNTGKYFNRFGNTLAISIPTVVGYNFELPLGCIISVAGTSWYSPRYLTAGAIHR